MDSELKHQNQQTKPRNHSNLNGQASTAADVTVKASAGSTVKLYNKDGVVIGEAVADNNMVLPQSTLQTTFQR